MGSPSQNRKNLCRLCWIKCEDFEVVGGNTKDNMDMLLLTIDLDVNEEPVICKRCVERVKQSFAFKSMCLDVRDYVISFVNKSNSKLDLKDVCLSQKKNNFCFPDDHDICGFCMGLVKSKNAVNIEGDNMLQKLMEKCLPELDLTIIRKPVICALCHRSLENYYQFVSSCLILEEKIKKYCQTYNIANNKTDLISIPQFTLSDILASEDGTTVDTINEGKSFLIAEKVNDLAENKNEILMEMSRDQKFDSVLFTPEDGLSCEQEDKKDHMVKSEGDFYAEQANKVAEKNEKFVEVENQNRLFNEDIEIKVDQENLDRFQDSVMEPCSDISTHDLREREILEKHNLIRKGNTVYQSDSCSDQTSYKGCLNRPSPVHKKAPPVTMYQCELCPFKTKRKSSLNIHMLTHKKPSELKMHQCEYCEFQTKMEKNLKLHLLVHKDPSEVVMYKCDTCSYQTKRKDCFKMHSLVHRDSSEVTMYKCESCSYQTKYRNAIRTHILIHRESSERHMYQCASCSFQTQYKQCLKVHVLVHKDSSEVTMYDCASCSYQTKYRNALKVHSLLHKDSSEVTMYQCDSCSYKTMYKKILKRHALIHKDSSEVTMHQCNSCSFQTKYKNGLKMHTLLHKDSSEATIYQCNSCSYRTKRKRALKSHMLRHKDS